MEEHFGTTLGQQGAEPWLRLCVVSDFHDRLRPRVGAPRHLLLPHIGVVGQKDAGRAVGQEDGNRALSLASENWRWTSYRRSTFPEPSHVRVSMSRSEAFGWLSNRGVPAPNTTGPIIRCSSSTKLL